MERNAITATSDISSVFIVMFRFNNISLNLYKDPFYLADKTYTFHSKCYMYYSFLIHLER